MPKENSTNEFKSWPKTFSVPLVIYGDKEAVTFRHDTCGQNPDSSYMLTKETQKPCAIGFCSVDKAGGSDYYSFEGEKCIQVFSVAQRERKIYFGEKTEA